VEAKWKMVPVRCLVVSGNTGQQRWLKPSSELIQSFQVHVGRVSTVCKQSHDNASISAASTAHSCTSNDIRSHTHARACVFNVPLSWTTRMSRYQKGKTNLDFTEARDCVWLWHLLGYMQVCTSLQTDNHASTPPLLPPNQQRQSTEG